MKPLLPPPGRQPPLPQNASATAQLARLLDALLVLDAEESCSIGNLADRVGLKPQRLRELLSSFMVAGDAIGPEAPFNIVFGSASGPFDADTEYDADQASADYVYRASATLRDEQVSLVDDVGRAPVTIDQVAAAVLAGRALLESGTVEERYRDAVAGLVDKLATSMHMTLNEPVDPDAQKLRAAAQSRQRVRFGYLGLGEGVEETVTVESYDVRRRRDRFVLDAGPDPVDGYRTYDVASMSDVEAVGEPGAFTPPDLPPAEVRDRPIEVVVSVTAQSPAAARLRDGWHGQVVAADGPRLHVRIEVDRPAAPRLGVLLLQLGSGCRVVSPESLRSAAVPVATRILAAHPA